MNKTQPNSDSVNTYLSAIKNQDRQADAIKLEKLITKIIKVKPVMWGSSIIGYGTHHYIYESGREGDIAAIGFSSRSQALTIYGLFHFKLNHKNIDLAKQLGSHSNGKGCLYIKKLSDIDLEILSQMIKNAYIQRAS